MSCANNCCQSNAHADQDKVIESRCKRGNPCLSCENNADFKKRKFVRCSPRKSMTYWQFYLISTHSNFVGSIFSFWPSKGCLFS